MIIDANIFIGESLLRNSVSTDDLYAMMRLSVPLMCALL